MHSLMVGMYKLSRLDLVTFSNVKLLAKELNSNTDSWDQVTMSHFKKLLKLMMAGPETPLLNSSLIASCMVYWYSLNGALFYDFWSKA